MLGSWDGGRRRGGGRQRQTVPLLRAAVHCLCSRGGQRGVLSVISHALLGVLGLVQERVLPSSGSEA
jgi:hypothetical protein